MVKECELRRIVSDDVPQVVCGAGGLVLARASPDRDATWHAICNACPIPDQLATDRWACLHLRPLKVASKGEDGRTFREYYACHWFYRLYRHGPPTTMAPCHGCPYWFPRPPMAQMEGLGYWKDQAEVLAEVRAMLDTAENIPPTDVPQTEGGDKTSPPPPEAEAQTVPTRREEVSD